MLELIFFCIFCIVFLVWWWILLLGVWLVKFCNILIVREVCICDKVVIIEIWVKKNVFCDNFVSCCKICFKLIGGWVVEIVFKIWIVFKCNFCGILGIVYFKIRFRVVFEVFILFKFDIVLVCIILF